MSPNYPVLDFALKSGLSFCNAKESQKRNAVANTKWKRLGLLCHGSAVGDAGAGEQTGLAEGDTVQSINYRVKEIET